MHKRSIAGLAVLALLAITAGCSGTRTAYQSAETLDAKAYVMGEHFNALQQQAVAIADAGAPQSVVDQLAEVELEARPVILELLSVAEAYQAARTAETQLALQQALNQAALALSRLIDTVKQAGGDPQTLNRATEFLNSMKRAA